MSCLRLPSATRLVALAALLLLPVPACFAADAPPQTAGAHPLPGYEVIRLGRGHYNRMNFVATIDGVKGLMVVDTGAAVTVLNAAKYGFLLKNDVKRPANLPAVSHLNEKSQPVAVAANVQFGVVHLANVPFPLVPEGYLYDQLYRGASDQQYDGFLGENILRHYSALLDCSRLALYLNTDPARKLHPGRALVQNGWTAIPMTNVGRNFSVPCTLSGHPYRLLVDTGSPYTVFETSILYKEHIAQDEVPLRGAVIGYNPKQEFLVHSNTLQIGDYVAVNVHPLSDPEISRPLSQRKIDPGQTPLVGLLGGDALANNSAMIDIGDNVLYLKHSDESPAHPPQ